MGRKCLELRGIAAAPTAGIVSGDGSPVRVRTAQGLLCASMGPWMPVPVPMGALVLALAAVATFGHLTRNLVLVLRHEPGHRNVIFWSPPRR